MGSYKVDKNFIPYLDEIIRMFKQNTLESAPGRVCTTVNKYIQNTTGNRPGICVKCPFYNSKPNVRKGCVLSFKNRNKGLIQLDLLKKRIINRRIQNAGVK